MRCKKKIAQLILTAFFITLMVQTAFCEDTPPVGQSKSEAVTGEQGISADIFGQKGGRFHPFLLFEAIYTDNLFATHSNTKSDFITTIAPGIWLAFPPNREKLLSIDTTTTSPGGLNLSRIKPEATRRYQSYFLYSPEFVQYSDHSTHNHANHRVEGLLQYNFNSGLSFDLIDLFHDREEIAGNGITDTLYQHQDNLLDFITTYDAPSGKFKLQFSYSNYDISYKDDAVNYRDRNDNSFGISVFHKFWPRTSLFVEYNYSDINFDEGAANDSVENRYYAGVNWEMTAKTRGTLKLGYTDKDFDLPTAEDQDDFSVELQTQVNLTPKRSLQINGYRKFHESDMANASSYLSTGVDIGLMQRFTEKWSGTLNAFYEDNKYNGIDRNDDSYGWGPAIRFEPKKWLIFDLGYQYHMNNSSVTFFDYEVHQVFLRASLSM
jgi:hypothetical protein